MSAGFGVKAFKATVTSAGTRVPLSATPIYTPWVKIQALTGNAGVVYLGGDDVSATKCISMSKTATDLSNIVDLDKVMLRGNNESYDLSKIYIDAANSNDAVNVIYAIE